MDGPKILVESLSKPLTADKNDNLWQYHSRSDRHSKVACWGVAFDLLGASALLQKHVVQGKVVLGVNHTMTDYATSRKKDLDLVFARPLEPINGQKSFKSLVNKYSISLSANQKAALARLPDVSIAPVGAVLMALEAKATMTAHIKALPRLYDELNSSHLCIHGASTNALAVGFVMVNASPRFASSDNNKGKNTGSSSPALKFNKEKQPESVKRTLEKVSEIPRRSNVRADGFDGVGVVVINGANDGSPFKLVTDPPAPQAGHNFHYDGMITRMANEYDTRFASI